MSAARWALVAANASVAAAIHATYRSSLGAAPWHDEAAYAALALGAFAVWPLWRRRRFTTLVMASLGGWCLFTGLFLVYATPYLGWGRWMRWWHAATGVGFLLAFLVHWARNHARLRSLARKLSGRRVEAAAATAAWTAIGAVWAWSGYAHASAFLWNRAFMEVSTLALALAALVPAAVAWAVRRARARAAATEAVHRLRGAVDLSLLAATWLATLTAVPLLYFTRPLRAVEAYWFVAAWHVVVSALLVGLVAVHVAFNARPLRSHAR